MRGLRIAVSFLTRLPVGTVAADPAAFGRSFVYLPLVGLLLGLFQYGGAWLGGQVLHAPAALLAALLLLLEAWLTGGLHWDGYMDAMDGLFSARERERMLEIMRDSRVGAHGVTAFGFLLLAKYAAVMELLASQGYLWLLLVPFWARWNLGVLAFTFPYARPEGMGKALAQHGGWGRVAIMALYTLPLGGLLGGWVSLAVAAAMTLLAWGWGKWVQGKIGGLTGDVFGATVELMEGAGLVLAVLLSGQ